MGKYSWALQKPRMMISLAENMAVYQIGKKKAAIYHLRKDGMVQKGRQPLLWVYRGFEQDRRFTEGRFTERRLAVKNSEIRSHNSEIRSQNDISGND